MEIKIGITDVAREVTITTDMHADAVVAALRTAQAKNDLFEIEDDRGRVVVVPADRIGYLDLGASDSRPVGFGSV